MEGGMLEAVDALDIGLMRGKGGSDASDISRT